MKILVVEDERELMESIIQYLEEEKYFCEMASDFDSASEKISLYRYDCVVLDLTLPRGNGLTLLRELKKRITTRGVIIISAKSSLENKIEGFELGADDYLSKPFSSG